MTINTELIKAYSKLKLHDSNEANTRLRIIDRVVLEILGWGHEDLSVEERVSEDGKTTFADYVIRTASVSLVIEAKKVGVSFDVVPNARRVKLTGKIMEGATGEAIIQARDYCRKLSIPFAVVTNGAQWIVFPANRIDQVPFSSSSAIIFDSLESILRDHYDEFSNLLSRENVISGSLETELLGRTEDQTHQRRLRNYYTNRAMLSGSNPLYPLIEDAVLTSFSDVIAHENPELLEKCYVNTPDRRKFDRLIQMYLTKKQSLFSKQPKRPLKKGDGKALDDVILKTKMSGRPFAILILGTVGAGKTTFLQYTRQVTSASVFEKSKGGPYPHWIYVDMRDYIENIDPADFIYSLVSDYMANDEFFSNYEQCVRPAYSNEIRQIKEGPLKLIAKDEAQVNGLIAKFLLDEHNDKNKYVNKLLSYAAKKSPVFLVIDNVDQFDDANQATIFRDSMAIAHRNNLNLIISLRDATFAQHRSSSTFDAFDFNPIYIDPPSISSVLSKRFFLMKQLLANKSGAFIAENGAKVEVSDLSMIADIITSSVLGSNVGSVIDILATSDVRLALRMTREFLESGYTNPGRAIETYKKSGQYVLPRHEALRSVLLGKQAVYSEEFSVIGNPFDARLSKTNSQLLRLYILTAMVSLSSNKSFQSIEGTEVKERLIQIGFSEDIVLRVLSDLCVLRWIQTYSHEGPSLVSGYYPTRLGGYVVRFLLSDLTFIEAVMMDTFITDGDVWNNLRTISDAINSERDIIKRLHLRNKRINNFIDYAESLYLPLRDEAQRRGLPPEWCLNPFADTKNYLVRNIEKAVSSAYKNYAPKKKHNKSKH